MYNLLIVASALVLLAGLLFFETRESTWGKLLTKTPLSMLFLTAVLLQSHPDTWYFHFLFFGLLFCLGGDVCLALPSDRMFLAGLVSFLTGHVFYVLGFIRLTGLISWAAPGTLVVLAVSTGIYLYLRPHLGSLSKPVLGYVAVISLMLAGALAALLNPALSLIGRLMLFTGALFFYLSDLFVARDRFIKKEPLNRYVGLPMYYGGQFLLAFSVGLMIKPPA